MSVLPFISDDEDPWRSVAALRDALAPGSYLALCHGTDESNPSQMKSLTKVYRSSISSQSSARSRAEILRFFDGFDLVDPGLVYIGQWRPGVPADAVTGGPDQFWGLVGIGRKPA